MILIMGLINLETTLQVDQFPITYFPVRYSFNQISSTVSGVGFNVAKALYTLSEEVQLLSMIGSDSAGNLIQQEISWLKMPGEGILPLLDATPQSVILYDPSGRRQINVDLKTIQDTPYPSQEALAQLDACAIAVLCNINFARPFLHEAKSRGKLIATDVHSISDLHDPYNADFMVAADILFLSHENLQATPQQMIDAIQQTYQPEIVVIGLGESGALMAVRGDKRVEHVPAVKTRPVINTIGAGDALFSGFVHTYARSQDPYLALRKAVVFASYKIGVAGAADGFLTSTELDNWYNRQPK